jgi:hypothetical protein
MAYRIAGTYVVTCNCSLLCPCPVDGPPTGPGGQCRGAAVFAIREGDLDGTDLSGIPWALYNHFPSNISAGNWRVGIVVDESASDEQAQAIERIVSGDEGGPFGDFKPLIGEYAGMTRGRVTLDGKSGSVAGIGDFQFEPLTGPDGSPTTVKGAMFAFAPEFTVGRGSGSGTIFGESVDFVYGESAEFDYTSETTDIHARG